MEPMHDDEAELQTHHAAEPGADVIALPQLERLPPSPDFPEPLATGLANLDIRSSRLEALEIVRSAVELADRIERDAKESAQDWLTRVDDEVRGRQLALEEREHELRRLQTDLEAARDELGQMRSEVERYHRQAEEAIQDARALQARTEQEATEKIALANTQAEAILEHAHREAEEVAAAARQAADQLLGETQRAAEASRIQEQEHRERERAEQASPAAVEGDLDPVELDETSGEEPETADEQASPPPQSPESPETASEAPAQRTFTPPPSSLEDLAAVSGLPRFIPRNPFHRQ